MPPAPEARSRPTAPRIEPLGPDERSDEVRKLLDAVRVGDGGDMHIFATLARHPQLLRRWMAFGGELLFGGALPGRQRELLILRTAWRCQTPYEWGHHVELARQSGLADDEIQRVAAGPEASGWDEFEATLLRAADELHDDACVSDTTWAALAERYDDRQLIELTMLVGQYHLVAFALNSLGVQPEEGLAPLPEG